MKIGLENQELDGLEILEHLLKLTVALKVRIYQSILQEELFIVHLLARFYTSGEYPVQRNE